MPDVLLYGNINSYSARQFITDLQAVGNSDVTVRVNSDGGDVRYGWGIITKLSELKGNVRMVNDSAANSMAAFTMCYGKNNMCADYSTFGFHRAAYPDWFEADPEFFTAEAKAELMSINSNLQKAFEAKIDPAKFEEVSGLSTKELFSMNGRKEVVLNAKQAKKLGLVDEIMQITPQKKKEVEALKANIMAKFTEGEPSKSEPIKQPSKSNKMTLSELKSEHPELYTQIVTAERERCSTWAAFSDVDFKAVQEGIDSGKDITGRQQADFLRKQISADMGKKVEDENVEDVKVKAQGAGVKQTEAEKNQAEVIEAVRKNLNLAK